MPRGNEQQRVGVVVVVVVVLVGDSDSCRLMRSVLWHQCCNIGTLYGRYLATNARI